MPAATEEESAVIGRRRWLVPASLPLLIVLVAAVAVGCGGGPAGVLGGGDAPNEASLGVAYTPLGFGEGSVWAIKLVTCDEPGRSWGFGDGGSGGCGAPGPPSLDRLDPETGEVVASIPLEGFDEPGHAEVAFGAGSVWVSPADYYPFPDGDYPFGGVKPGNDAVLRIDPRTNRIAQRIRVPSPSGVAFGFGSAWVTDAISGTVLRIDPTTGGVAARIGVGRGAGDVAADERSGAVWVAGQHLPEVSEYLGESPPPERSTARKLTRVDPRTNRVAAEVPLEEATPGGGVRALAVGEGAVWAASATGKLFMVDPRTNGVVAVVPLGDYVWDLAVSGGSVWATAQHPGPFGGGTRLVRVNPRDAGVVGSGDLGRDEDSGGDGRLAADATGGVWTVSSAKTGRGTLTRISP